MNGLGALPLLFWGAVAGGGALLSAAAGWWGRGAADAVSEGSGPVSRINIPNPPAPPAPQTLEDLTGGWTPAKLDDAYRAAWDQYRIQASESVVLRPPVGDAGAAGSSWLLYLGIGVAGALLLTRRY